MNTRTSRHPEVIDLFPLRDPLLWLDLARALQWRSRALRAADRAGRDDMLAIQRRRLDALLRHAAERSSFYRRRWQGRVPAAADLPALEPVDKTSLLIDHFDEAITVPGLTLDAARARLRTAGGRQRGDWIVVATSGTTGVPAVVPFTRRDWRLGMAAILRGADLIARARSRTEGLATILHTLRERPRVAGISTLNPIHISAQMSASFRTGLVPSLRLPASLPVDELLARIERFRPTVVGAYPSALELLARAAEEGALRIRPELVFTGGETVTPTLRQRVRELWGTEIFDFYGLSETLIIAGECGEHRGMHVFEDLAVLEVVDAAGRVLPPGERGAGVLVTSLVNHALPVIRYVVSDLMTLTDEPCPCGLPYRRIVAVDGRREQLLSLRRLDGSEVEVHPFTIETPLEETEGVRRFRIRADGEGGVRIEIVPAHPAATLPEAARARVVEALRPLGIPAERVRLETVERIEERRGATDKLVRTPARDT